MVGRRDGRASHAVNPPASPSPTDTFLQRRVWTKRREHMREQRVQAGDLSATCILDTDQCAQTAILYNLAFAGGRMGEDLARQKIVDRPTPLVLV